MPDADAATREPFSAELERWLQDDTPKTLGELEKVFGERSFAVAILLLMFPSALPIPTGGVTHVLEVMTVLLAVQMVVGRRTIWLPQRWKRRELGSFTTDKAIPFIVRRIRWFERWSRPRAAGLFERSWFLRLLGVAFIAFAAGAIIAPPFSGLDTLPSMGAVLVALAIILHDVVLLGAGLAIGAGGLALALALGAAAVRFFRGLF